MWIQSPENLRWASTTLERTSRLGRTGGDVLYLSFFILIFVLKQAPSPFLVVKPDIISKFQKVLVLNFSGKSNCNSGTQVAWRGWRASPQGSNLQICSNLLETFLLCFFILRPGASHQIHFSCAIWMMVIKFILLFFIFLILSATANFLKQTICIPFSYYKFSEAAILVFSLDNPVGKHPFHSNIFSRKLRNEDNPEIIQFTWKYFPNSLDIKDLPFFLFNLQKIFLTVQDTFHILSQHLLDIVTYAENAKIFLWAVIKYDSFFNFKMWETSQINDPRIILTSMICNQ